MEKVDILGTALWRCTILEGVSKNIGGGGGAQYSDWSMFCACMPLTQTALSMYREQILCFLMEKVDILGTALWRCTILEGVSKNIGGGGGAYSDWSMFCACMPLTQTALSMYREQNLCFLMEKVDILGTALWRCTILEGVSKNIGGGGGAVL